MPERSLLDWYGQSERKLDPEPRDEAKIVASVRRARRGDSTSKGGSTASINIQCGGSKEDASCTERCAGIDVHKKSITVCRITPKETGDWQREVRTFGTMTTDLLEAADWLAAGGVTHVAMESTGVFWRLVWGA